MKKALTLVVLVITPSLVFAQGTVVFQNLTGLVQRWTSASDSSLTPVPVGGGYVQLIATPKGNPLLHPFGVYDGSSGFLPGYSSLAAFLAANPGWAVPWSSDVYGEPHSPLGPAAILFPGYFNGGVAVITNLSLGEPANYVVIGWTGPYASYDAAYAADLANPGSSYLGMSAIATTQTADPTLVNPMAPVSLYATFEGIILAPAAIPEPTTVLLAGLGAVALLVCRRCR